MQFAKPDTHQGLWVRQKRGKNAIGAWTKLPGENRSSFTPNLRFGGNNASMTGTFVGQYHKIGRFVFLSVDITLTAKGSSTSNATIGNLPFTFLAGIFPVVNVVVYANGASITSAPTGYIDPGSNDIKLFLQTSTGLSAMTDANFTNTTRIFVTAVGITDNTYE